MVGSCVVCMCIRCSTVTDTADCMHPPQVCYLTCQALEQLLLDSKLLDGMRQVRHWAMSLHLPCP